MQRLTSCLFRCCRYHNGRFDLDNAKGPLRLDLGDTLYAPNIMRDDAGRVILWGWLQERRTVSKGCLKLLCFCDSC
jgi:hypothetical protein